VHTGSLRSLDWATAFNEIGEYLPDSFYGIWGVTSRGGEETSSLYHAGKIFLDNGFGLACPEVQHRVPFFYAVSRTMRYDLTFHA